MDQDFESGVQLIRDAYRSQLNSKESEILRLSADNARKDAHIKDLESRMAQMSAKLRNSEKKLLEMTKSLSKLNHFKQSVMESFEMDGEWDFSFNSRNKSSMNVPFYSPDKLSNKTAEVNILGADHTFDEFGHSVSLVDDISKAPSFFSPGKNPISGMLGSPSPRRQNPLKSHRLDSPSRNKKNLTPRKHAKFEHEFDNLDEKPEMEEVSFASTVRNGDSNRNPKDYSTLHQQEQLKQSTANTNILDNPTQVPITVDGRDYFRKVKSILTYDQFTRVLKHVKSFNQREQNKSETLKAVQSIMGPSNQELYHEFETLISGNDGNIDEKHIRDGFNQSPLK